MSIEFIGHVFPLAYVDAGASTLLIRGYEPYNDAVAYGEVISLVRERALVAA